MFKFQFCSGPLQNWPGRTIPFFPVIRKALFLIDWLLPPRAHLRTELVDDLLQVLYARQLLLHGRRQLASDLIRGHTNRLIGVLESKFDQRTVPALAQENSDARAFDRSSHRAVHRRQVKAKLAGMFWLESPNLQFENKISVQADMVKQQIDVERLLVHGHGHLTPDEGEASAQL